MKSSDSAALQRPAHTRHECARVSRLALLSCAALVCVPASWSLAQTSDPQRQGPVTAPASGALQSPTLQRLASSWAAGLSSASPADAAAFNARASEVLTLIESRLPRAITAFDTSSGLASPTWFTSLEQAADTRRERIIQSIVKAWGDTLPPVPQVQAQIDTVAPAHARWLENAALFSRQLAAVESALQLGIPLNQPFKDESDQVLGAAIQDIERSDLLTDPSVRQSVQAPLDKLSRVLSTARSEDLGMLVDLAASERDDDRALAIVAWRRLGATRTAGVAWPATGEQLRTEARLGKHMRAIAMALPEPRRSRFLDEITIEQKRRYSQLLSVARDADAMIEALSVADEFGLDRTDLQPRMRFNVALLTLRKRVNEPGITDAQAKAAAEAFLGEVGSIRGGVSYLTEAQQVIAPLQTLLRGDPVRAPLDRAAPAMGPALTGLWTQTVSGDTVRFVPRQPALPTLTFVRVDAGSADEGVFLQTTEVSVGQFARLAAELGRRSELERLLPLFTTDTDARPGIRSWVWTNDGPLALVPAPAWFPPRRDVAVARIDLITPPKPSTDTPIQQISPLAAAYVSSLIHCRLPSSGEWQAALGRAGQSSAAANIRDKQVADWIQAQPAGSPIALEATAGVLGVDNPTLVTLQSAPRSDGALFLRDIGDAPTDQPIKHLDGNVSEFVTDAQGRFSVIGASALSDVGAETLTRRILQDQRSVEGFADVGFRMAFSAPVRPVSTVGLASRIARLVNPPPVLLPR